MDDKVKVIEGNFHTVKAKILLDLAKMGLGLTEDGTNIRDLCEKIMQSANADEIVNALEEHSKKKLNFVQIDYISIQK